MKPSKYMPEDQNVAFQLELIWNTHTPASIVDFPDRETRWFKLGADAMLQVFKLSAEGVSITVDQNGWVEWDTVPAWPEYLNQVHAAREIADSEFAQEELDNQEALADDWVDCQIQVRKLQ